MAAPNSLWPAPRIHGELKMLDITVSERTVSQIIRTLRRPPNQTWKTFLHNHLCQTISMDFFTVPTIPMRVLFVFHRVRNTAGARSCTLVCRTIHTAAWTSQQIREAFADRQPAQYAIRDRDGVYGNLVCECIASLGMEEVLTAPQSLWQDPYAERLVGTLRRECLNYFGFGCPPRGRTLCLRTLCLRTPGQRWNVRGQRSGHSGYIQSRKMDLPQERTPTYSDLSSKRAMGSVR